MNKDDTLTGNVDALAEQFGFALGVCGDECREWLDNPESVLSRVIAAISHLENIARIVGQTDPQSSVEHELCQAIAVLLVALKETQAIMASPPAQ